MPPITSAARLLVSIAVPVAVFGSCSSDTSLPTDPPPPPPAASHKWSDPASWPSHAVPVLNEDVTVPAGESTREFLSQLRDALMHGAGHVSATLLTELAS